MRLTALPLLLAFVALGVSAAPSFPTTTLRIVSYNIHHGEGMDGLFDLPRTAKVLTDLQPDLIALQEVDRHTERSGRVDQPAALAALTGMHMTFSKAMDFQGGEYGVAILSRFPLKHVQTHALPQGDNLEPRTLLSVDVEPAGLGHRVQFSTTHLDQGRDTGNRMAQVAAINERLAQDDRRLSIIAGDFNSRFDTDVMAEMRTRWADMTIEPLPPGAERPRYKVDYVLVRPPAQWHLVEYRAPDAPGVSDHRPVLAVLAFGAASN